MAQKKQRQPGIHLHKTVVRNIVGSKLQYSDEYYWILIAKNGKTIAKSSETYKTKRAAVRSIQVAKEIFSSSDFFIDHTGKVGPYAIVVI